MKKILVVAAHPDDEVLGVGATIAKHIETGDIAYALILGEGQTSRTDQREQTGQGVIDELHRDSIRSSKRVGYEDIFFENLPDNRFDQLEMLDITKVVEKYINNIKPDIIYTHHGGDLNVDHRYTYNAVMTATRPICNCSVKEIYCFETMSSTEWNFSYGDNIFMPTVFVDVTGFLDKKLDAMREYKTELCEFPHPRSIKNIEATAVHWGSVSGANYAEAFEIMRIIK